MESKVKKPHHGKYVRHGRKYFCMAVTPDKYELPLIVTESYREMAEITGVSENNIKSSIAHKSGGERRGYKFVRCYQ